jgi:hypothetical protein
MALLAFVNSQRGQAVNLRDFLKNEPVFLDVPRSENENTMLVAGKRLPAALDGDGCIGTKLCGQRQL